MKRLIWIATWLLVIGLLLEFGGGKRLFVRNTTIRAVGDLSVDWGVPEGNPIFVVGNMAPGDTEIRTVEIKNDGSAIRPVGVRGVKTDETGNLSAALSILVSEGGSGLYGEKPVSEFFADSGGPMGIFLFYLDPGETKFVDFKVTFDEEAGNDFQNKLVVFDLIIGISVEVPEECSAINFSGSPIFGTSGRDNLNGTNGNDLIFAFEGNDVVNASNGDDCIVGGAGDDIIHASNGNDVLIGGEGNDRLYASNGNDAILGGNGRDVIFGSNGDDKIDGGDGDDDIDGGNGNDEINGGAGNDDISGGNGNDVIYGGEGNDRLRGGNGNDVLIGEGGIDRARGDLGRDTCDAEIKTSCEI